MRAPRAPRLTARTLLPPPRPRLKTRATGGTDRIPGDPPPESSDGPSRPKLRRVRDPDSLTADDQILSPRGEDDATMPPFVQWGELAEHLDDTWEAGQHVAIVGMTGSGKTVLMRELLEIRDYVVVVATKPQDRSLYGPLEDRGYKIVDKFDPRNIDDPKVIFRPPLRDLSREAEAAQRESIREALMGIYQAGGWCVALDEVRYLSEQLKLVRELNLLWLQGRSLGVTLVAATQRPVSVPLNMFEQADIVTAFRTTGKEDRKRTAEYTGEYQGVMTEALPRIPRYEFIMVDKKDSEIMRSKVDL